MYRGKVIPLHNDLNAMVAAEHQYTQASEGARLQLQSLDKKREEIKNLASVVQDLPLKVSHSVMVRGCVAHITFHGSCEFYILTKTKTRGCTAIAARLNVMCRSLYVFHGNLRLR